MTVQQLSPAEIALRSERGMAIAEKIIKDSWLAAGMTEEDWVRSPIIADVYEMLVHRGSSDTEAEAYIDATSWEEIQRKHREMYPGQYRGK